MDESDKENLFMYCPISQGGGVVNTFACYYFGIAVQRMPSGAQVRILSLTHIFSLFCPFSSLGLGIPACLDCIIWQVRRMGGGTCLTYIQVQSWTAIAEKCKVLVLSVGNGEGVVYEYCMYHAWIGTTGDGWIYSCFSSNSSLDPNRRCHTLSRATAPLSPSTRFIMGGRYGSIRPLYPYPLR